MKYHVFFFGGRSEARAASETIRLKKAILLSPEFCHHLQTVPFVIIITIFIIIIVIFIIINVIVIILITFCQNAASCKVSHLSYSNAHSSDV